MKGLIPTGGRGTRMRPLTLSANKHFIPVGNKPLIYYPVETLAATGIKQIGITYNPGQLDMAKSFLGDGSQWGLDFTYILQPEPKGLANIIQVAEEYIAGDSFVFHLGDNIFTQGINNLIQHFEDHQPDGLVGIVHHSDNTRLGVPYFDQAGRLIKYVEKPKHPPHDFAIPGVYIFSPVAYRCFSGKDAIQPSPRGEYEIASVFQWLIDHHKIVDTLEITGKWLDPGKVEDWLDANRYLLDQYTQPVINSSLDKTVNIKGRVTIGHKCKIKNSTIKGPVNIGDNVTITDSNIGPFTSIYHNCVITNSSIADSVLMESVTVDNVKKDIENSLIGPNTCINQNSHSEHHMELLVSELSKITL